MTDKQRRRYWAIRKEREKLEKQRREEYEAQEATRRAILEAEMQRKAEKRKVSLLNREEEPVVTYRSQEETPFLVYREKQNKKYLEAAFATNKVKMLSREFVYRIGQSVSTLHGNGMYAFCALICHAHTYDRKNTGYAWVSGSKKEIMQMIGARTPAELDSLLNFLEEKQAIHVCHTKTTDKLVIQMMNYLSTNAMTKKQIQAEYAAIHNHSGFVYVHLDPLVVYGVDKKKYSEADALIDLWFSVVYKDKNIPFSKVPVVNLYYDCRFADSFFNTDGDIISGYRGYAERWACSLSRVGKMIRKFQDLGFIDPQYVPNHGTVIFMPIFVKLLFKKNAKKINFRKVCEYFIPHNYTRNLLEFVRQRAKKSKVKRDQFASFLERLIKYTKKKFFKNTEEKNFYFFGLTIWRSLFEHPEIDNHTLARQTGQPLAFVRRLSYSLFI